MSLPKRLKDIDTPDNILLLTLAVRIGPPIMLILMLFEYAFFRNRFIWFIIPDLAATALLILAARWGLDQFARGAGSILMPSGNGTPTAREYSEQEALVIRGHYVEAADAFRAIAEDEHANIDVRMRLGALLEKHCADPEGAAFSYRSVRRLSPTPHQDLAASNALIELYQRTGAPEKVTAELMRLSRQYGAEAIGKKARDHLERLRGEAAPQEPPIAPPE